VVASQLEKFIWVLDFVSQQEADSLQTLLPAIYIVPQKEVVGIGRETPILEELKKVVVLAVYIPHKILLALIRWAAA
jgi:hypothetical protein